ncbi:arsenate reductase ArsC [candidate division KSB1 bacterium]
MDKKKILFVCTHNSSRSQIAEGLLNHLFGNKYEAFSAGTQPGGVNKYAVEALKETGIDISFHKSENIIKYLDINFDYVITVCDSAKETCSYFPNGKIFIHKSFTDPSAANGSEEEILQVFRNVRDQIKDFIIETFGNND